jgi:signal transduction histidine kinase
VPKRLEGDLEGVVVRVEDSGPGIPAEIVPMIFDPFFTTKAPGEGTGLGLAISERIVRAHGGRLSCESPPGKGAIFVVELPLRPPEDSEAARTAAHPGRRPLTSDTGRVL